MPHNLHITQLYPVNLQHSSYNHVFTSRVENSVDPDQIQGFQMRIKPGSAG